MRHHADECAHPLVNVAFHRNHDFRTRELRLQFGRRRRLLLAPLAIFLGQRMDVVRNRVAVFDGKRLAGLDTENMRRVETASLVESYGRLWRLEGFSFQAGLDIDKGVHERGVFAGDYGLIVDGLTSVHFGACGFGVHGDWNFGWLWAAEGDFS